MSQLSNYAQQKCADELFRRSLQDREDVIAEDPEGNADRGPGDNVAEKMQAEDNAGRSDQKRDAEKVRLQLGVEQADGERQCESCDGMARGKGVFVGRQNGRPAMRLDFARSFAAAGLLEGAEDQDAGGGRRGSGGNLLYERHSERGRRKSSGS